MNRPGQREEELQEMPMRILVVGAGATGGYFGAGLAQAGRDVTFLVRPRRAEQLRRSGLRIVGPHGDLTLEPRLVTAREIRAPYDVVLLSVKAYALETAMEDFAPAIGPTTMILPMLNGMRHVDLLAKRFGEDAVVGGVCLLAADLDAEGRIVQIADIQQLIYGERSGEKTPRLEVLDSALQGAGFDARLSTNIMQAMWEKWVQLASLGAVTCLLRGPIGEIVAAPGGVDISLALLDESVAIAAACGHRPGDAFLKRHAAAITAAGSPFTSSMYRDLRKGAPVEVDQILGDFIERGRAEGVETPLLKAAFVNLRVYQAQLSRR
jgi:2-dehydropantoate 2-reductase